ncbi:MAG: hypothetical protein IPL78_31855 [Chloroflexi bacterium]|nr:hypothetical protein [Chloroflexota bacterium]
MTPKMRELASYYIGHLYPPSLHPMGGLILATSRLLKNGEGGQLLGESLSRIRLSERVAYLGHEFRRDKIISP